MPPPLSKKPGLRLLLAACYLLTSAVFLALHALGLTPGGALSYTFTWDMFPGFQSSSTRRVAIGITAAGQAVLLHPSDRQQFREGLSGDMSRPDLERSARHFRSVAETVRLQTASQEAADPVVNVLLCEQFWPTKFNFSDRDYARWMGAAKPSSLRTGSGAAAELLDPPPGIPWASWRVLQEYTVAPVPAAMLNEGLPEGGSDENVANPADAPP